MNVMRLATAAPARHDGGRASCWLAGKCRKANASRYDKGLAAPVEVALKAVPEVETVVPHAGGRHRDQTALCHHGASQLNFRPLN